jgi:hypothetical protein
MRRRALFSMVASIGLLVASLSPVAAGDPLPQGTIDKIHDFVTSAFDELGVPGAAVVVVDADGIPSPR